MTVMKSKTQGVILPLQYCRLGEENQIKFDDDNRYSKQDDTHVYF